jgi:hypothetical protein
MHPVADKNRSLWWELAFKWLVENNPVLAEDMIRTGEIWRYLDQCEAADLLISTVLPASPASGITSGCAAGAAR